MELMNILDPKNDRYLDWIVNLYNRSSSLKLNSFQVAEEMEANFPELKLVKGSVLVLDPLGLYPHREDHFWCVNQDGLIIDPTAHQFPNGISNYFPDMSKNGPTGKCLNCGNLCYKGESFCSFNCEREYFANREA